MLYRFTVRSNRFSVRYCAMPMPLPIADALFGKTRRAVLALLYGHADRAF